MAKKGVLLINLGTPDSADPKSIYVYLTQFLNDPRVIDLPALIRMILVNALVIPLRYKQSAHAYVKIWTEQGSPLLLHSQALMQSVAQGLGDDFQVELGMRYGNPSIESALARLSACPEIAVIPLFPQYSSAATGSAIEEVLRLIKGQWNIPALHLKKDFFDNADFIAAYADVIQQQFAKKQPEVIIFSYHGLPERHIVKSNCKAACSRIEACPAITESNQYCYRAQCYETSRLLAQALKLAPEQYRVSFQSRLGRTPWIKPYTDEVLPGLIQQNIKNIAVVCPSFVADCLETLEEINIRARRQWQALGGAEFVFIPCINHHEIWVKGLIKMTYELLGNKK